MADLDVAAVVAAARRWPDVETGAATRDGQGAAPGDTVVLSTAGRTFALVSPSGVELTLPPRVRDMLVDTGRAAALPSPAHALVTPDGGGQIDLDLLMLAYERARVTTAVVRSGEPPR